MYPNPSYRPAPSPPQAAAACAQCPRSSALKASARSSGKALFREEQPGTVEFHATARTGNGLGQPVRPLHVEVDVVGAPDDQRGCGQRLQLRFDGDRVRAVEGREKALQIARALCAGQVRPQIGLDGVVAHGRRVFVGGTQRLGRTVEALVGQHRVQCAAQAATGGQREKRLEGFGRPVVVRVAIGQRQAAHALRMLRGKDQCHAAAAVVADEVDLLDVHRIEELREHLCIGGGRHVLAGRDLGRAVGQQVDRDAAPHAAQLGQLMAPQEPFTSTPCTKSATGPRPCST